MLVSEDSPIKSENYERSVLSYRRHCEETHHFVPGYRITSHESRVVSTCRYQAAQGYVHHSCLRCTTTDPSTLPKGVLLYGPPGTGKTLLARAVAATLDTNFLKVVSSAIVDKYIGESARLIREMFAYAKEHEPCIIFMDEIDAIGGRRFSEGTSADREIQRTLMEVRFFFFLLSFFVADVVLTSWYDDQLLNQLDGFDYLGKTKVIFATNRVRPSLPLPFPYSPHLHTTAGYSRSSSIATRKSRSKD